MRPGSWLIFGLDDAFDLVAVLLSRNQQAERQEREGALGSAQGRLPAPGVGVVTAKRLKRGMEAVGYLIVAEGHNRGR